LVTRFTSRFSPQAARAHPALDFQPLAPILRVFWFGRAHAFIRDVIHQKQMEESRGEKKMKTLKNIMLSVGAVALLGASGLSAQTKAAAAVPFEFSVQNTTLPAGNYTITATAHEVMTIRNAETGKAIMLLAPSSESGYRGTQDKNVVVFHKVADRYFLADVRTDAVSGHVSPSKLERELTSEGGQPAAVILPALSVR